MHLPDPAQLIAALASSGRRLAVVATGGGSLAIPHLVTTPGASGVVVDARVPYSRAAVDQLLGGPQESYSGLQTARRLAAAAWERVIHLDAAADAAAIPGRAVGVAVAASLKTSQPKRGSHRISAAVQTLAATWSAELVLAKEARSRADEELVAAALALDLVAEALDLPAGCRSDLPRLLRSDERIVRDVAAAPPEWCDLLGGLRSVAAADGGATPAPGGLIFPGSFDPLHEGHRQMARLAEEIAERPLAWEISVTNVEKPLLDYVSIRDRAAQFEGRRLWLTRAARFREKLAIFPEATFVMGADTYDRLADPRFYGGSAAAAAEAVETIAARARGLIVFGRMRNGVFEDAGQIDAPQKLRDISYFVSQREFRLDISSTELRRQETARREAACEA